MLIGGLSGPRVLGHGGKHLPLSDTMAEQAVVLVPHRRGSGVEALLRRELRGYGRNHYRYYRIRPAIPRLGSSS